MATLTSASSIPLPLIVNATEVATDASEPGSLLAWYEQNRPAVDSALLGPGAVLFRGFGIATPSLFKQVTRSLATRLIESVEENVPRTRLASGVYTSTEYPPEYYLSLHSEYSYSNSWPQRLFFGCVVAAEAGGETPLADNRTILQALDREVVAEFKRKKVSYIRNLHSGEGFGLSWQKAFQATEKAVVEQYCEQQGVDYRWTASGGLQLIQTMEATRIHATTQEEVWFNQAPQFHPTDYPADASDALINAYPDPDELPQYVRFGDRTEIDPGVLAHIRTVMKEVAVCFLWQEGDLLLLDNVLVAHGRKPFSGPRKILVAMAAG